VDFFTVGKVSELQKQVNRPDLSLGGLLPGNVAKFQHLIELRPLGSARELSTSDEYKTVWRGGDVFHQAEQELLLAKLRRVGRCLRVNGLGPYSPT
jgi:hypothetical protein